MTVQVRLISPAVSSDSHAQLLQTQYDLADVALSGAAVEKGPYEVETEIQDALAVPYILKRAIEAEREGIDAIVIDCMTDPGLRQAREAVSIPVVGVAETAMHLASQLSHKFGWIDPSEHSRAFVENQVLLYGLNGKLASFRAVAISPLQIHQNPQATEMALVKEALAAVIDDNAGILILGCTDFLNFKGAIERALLENGKNIQVIEPSIIAVLQAAALARTGLRHSKHTYPTPQKLRAFGYDDIPLSDIG